MRRSGGGDIAVPALKLTVYSPSQGVSTTYVWEPSNQGTVPFQTWTAVSINEYSGASIAWPGAGTGTGWWASGGNALWGSPPSPSTPQIDYLRSFWRYVDSLVNKNKPAIDDAVITGIQVGLGSGTPDSTSLFDQVQVVSGSYDYTYFL